jgi:hypothetical protein
MTLLAPAADQPTDGHKKPKREKLTGHEKIALQILNLLFVNGSAVKQPVFDHGP